MVKKVNLRGAVHFIRWGLRVLIVALLVWQSAQLLTRPMHGDEAVHAHVAYRISRGDRQFVDFFEHHCPGLWYLLLPYFFLGGYGAGVLFWGRALCILSLLLISLLCYLIGRRIGPPLTGELAVLIFLPFGIANQYLQVRPESIMLPFCLGAIYSALRFLEKPEKSKWLILGFALLSLSLFFAVRSLVVLFWLGIIYVIHFRRLKPVHHLLLSGALLIGPALLLETIGWRNCYQYRWVTRYILAFTPVLSLRQTWAMLSDRYVLLMGVLISSIAFFRSPRLARYLAGLTLIAICLILINVITGLRSPPYAWAVASIMAAIMFAYGCAFMLVRRGTRMMYLFVGILLLAWSLVSFRALTRPAFMMTPDGTEEVPNPATLAQEVAEMDSFCRRYQGYGPSWLVWDFDVQYIAVEDVSYFWHIPCDIPATLARLGVTSPVPRWAEEIRSHQPFALSKSLIDVALPGPEASPEWWEWFDTHYRLRKRMRGDYLYWRRDVLVRPQDTVPDE